MTSQSLFWLLLGCWALAVVVTVFKLAFDVLAADARGARLPARWLASAGRTFVRCGVMFTSLVVFAAIAKTIDENWDLSLKPFSYDLTAYSGSVKQAVLSVGVFICLMMINRFLDRLLDKVLPNGPANRTPTAGNTNDRARPAN
jgi:hypothetical protein